MNWVVKSLACHVAVVFLSFLNSGIAIAQEPLKEPRFYLNQTLEYYRKIHTVAAEFEVTDRREKVVDQIALTSDVNTSFRYFKSGEKQREEKGSPGDYRQVTVYRDEMMKSVLKESGLTQMDIQPDKGAAIGRAREGNQLFFKEMEALALWAENPESIEGKDLSVKYFTEADGRQTVEITILSGSEQRFLRRTFRIDPSRGYMPVFYEAECKDPPLSFHNQTEVRACVDAGDGLLAPTEVQEHFHSEEAGQIADSSKIVRVSKVTFNQTVDESLFELAPEPGTVVTDGIADITYQVKGEPADTDLVSQPLEKPEPPVDTGHGKPARAIAQPNQPATPEANNRAVYLIFGAAVAAVLLALWIGVRTYRKKSSQTSDGSNALS